MNTTKKLLIGAAALLAVVTGMQAQEENCDVCMRDPYGLVEKCWDVRLDDELKLSFDTREIPSFKVVDGALVEVVEKDIFVYHQGARLQWSVNLVDWKLFNHCRGVGIQPNLSQFAFSFGVGFRVGEKVDPHKVGDLNWEEGIYEDPNIRRLFVRLLPCDVNAHKEAYKNRKISIEKEFLYPEHSRNKALRADGIRVKVSKNYGVLESTRSLKFPDWGPIKHVGAGSGRFSRVQSPYNLDVSLEVVGGQWTRVTNGVVNMQFYRIKPLNKDAFKVFQIDLDEGTVKEEPTPIPIPTKVID